MKRLNREYSLVLPARTGPEYGGGWASGSVVAHWLHLKKGYAGVFWVWDFTASGIVKEDKQFLDQLIDPLGKPVSVDGSDVRISPRGFFYESNRHAVTWEFEAQLIVRVGSNNMKGRLERLKDHIPDFRKEYLKPKPWGSWLLIRKLQQLKNPIYGELAGNNYCIPGFGFFSNPKQRLVKLNTSHLRSGNSFVLTCPESIETHDPDPLVQIDDYLKRFLSDNPPKDRLRESSVHTALLLRLLKGGYYFMQEGRLEHGRYDFLLQDRKGNLFAVEIKLKEGDAAVLQLADYIEQLKPRYPQRSIRGVILCGHVNGELERKARERGFKALEFALSIEIPLERLAIQDCSCNAAPSFM